MTNSEMSFSGKEHRIVDKEEEFAVEAASMMALAASSQMPAMASMTMPMTMMSAVSSSGIRVTFKKAKISIDRMIISEKK
jgi:acetyl-CoA decarbonylase/synthase, CODH/ACS complex subunit beta